MSDLYDVALDSDLPRLVVAALRADSELAGFFGAASIREHDQQELRWWTPTPPYLAVTPLGLEEQRGIGGAASAVLRVGVFVYLHPMIPVDPSITELSAPSVAANGAGAMTGTFLYALTAVTPTGESAVKDSLGQVQVATITLASQQARVTLPTGGGWTGLRLWRTEANGLALRQRAWIAGDATASYDDNGADTVLGRELAPVRFLGPRLLGQVKRRLIAGEALLSGGYAQAYAFLGFADIEDVIRTDRNQRVLGFVARYPLKYDVQTRRSTVDVP